MRVLSMNFTKRSPFRHGRSVSGFALAAALLLACAPRHVTSTPAPDWRGTGDLGVVIERADGSLLVVEHGDPAIRCRVEGLGDLSHASVKFSRDQRYAFVFGRDGGLSKVDLLGCAVVARTIQAGNSIGGAISADGRVLAVGNYEPGGVRLFSTSDLEPLAEIPALGGDGSVASKVVGLVDAPGQRFVFSLFEAGEIWIADVRDPRAPVLTKFTDAGRNPYDGLITPDGRWYLVGLFGEDGLSLLDLWNVEAGPRRVLSGYGRGEERLPVYKMPHLEGWAMADGKAFLPAIGRHEVLVVEAAGWQGLGRIAVPGQPIFVIARPDGRQLWANFALPDNDRIAVIDAQSLAVIEVLRPGPAALHMEFTPRGEAVWISVRDADRVHVYDTETRALIAELPARKPSGIFFTDRAGRIGL